ncbi:hypothetical protein BBK36DRAFT_1161334 [Trichoderma citrinoviride]|uniref:SnoaL-like domain-containing protein n=1 Tax=Trichoderma citrinoviride TaxID=58853 RepID=A0A2T4B4Q1_9HYPO|nr:hypothetical protein BBK36DRAFT_1161334 [Trichoderma citrinoviride]PTB64280.1 hypothetical protein BBK36DRAFT_1161334 [Trichoderma citrinoviride]
MAGSSVDEAGYSPQYPADSSLPNGLQAFISEFYRISDRPEDNERWVGQFTEDARVVIGPGKATGTEELRTMRQGMWAAVAERKHTIHKVFPGRFDDEEEEEGLSAEEGNGNNKRCELMLYGDVAYRTKDGSSSTVPWAGHGVLEKVRDGEKGEEEVWKFAEYRVYLLR